MGYRVDLSDGGRAVLNATELVYYSGLGRVEHYLNTSGTLCRKDDFAMHFDCDQNMFTLTPIKSCMRRAVNGTKNTNAVKMKAQMLAVCWSIAEHGFITQDSIELSFTEPLVYLLSKDPAIASDMELFPALVCNADTRLIVLTRENLNINQNSAVIASFHVT